MEQDTFDLAAGVGRSQAFALIANKCSAAQAECMRQIHESQTYKSTGLSWEDFCTRHFGLTRRRVDDIIQRLEEFGTTYFQLCDLVRISTENYRQLAPAISGEALEIDGESIPIVPENAARIRKAVAARLKPPPARAAVSASAAGLRKRLDEWIVDLRELRSVAISGEANEVLIITVQTSIAKLQRFLTDIGA